MKKGKQDLYSDIDPSFLRDELLLMEHGPYRDLVTDRSRLVKVVGRPFGGERARGIAGGILDPRMLLRDAEIEERLAVDFPGEDGGDDDGRETDEDAEGELGTQANSSTAAGSSTQQASGVKSTASGVKSTQSSSGARTQRSSTSGDMISSLSPDLLASSQSQTPSGVV